MTLNVESNTPSSNIPNTNHSHIPNNNFPAKFNHRI